MTHVENTEKIFHPVASRGADFTVLKPEQELYGPVTYWPQQLTFASYEKLFSEFDFLKPMGNSLLVAVCTTAITLVVSTLAAYAFTRFEFKGRRGLNE